MCRLEIHDALRQPPAVLSLPNRQGVIGGAFDLDRRLMLAWIHPLSPGVGAALMLGNLHLEAGKEQLPRGHLIDQGIEPLS
jgi:hypothetical protein